MLYITHPPDPRNDNEEKRRLAHLRRAARRRGFRILKDWSGAWSLVDVRVAPAWALIGLFDVGLAEIESALSAPLPLPKIRTRKAKPTIEANPQNVADQGAADRGTEGAPKNAVVAALLNALREQQ